MQTHKHNNSDSHSFPFASWGALQSRWETRHIPNKLSDWTEKRETPTFGLLQLNHLSFYTCRPETWLNQNFDPPVNPTIQTVMTCSLGTKKLAKYTSEVDCIEHILSMDSKWENKNLNTVSFKMQDSKWTGSGWYIDGNNIMYLWLAEALGAEGVVEVRLGSQESSLFPLLGFRQTIKI